MKIKNDMVYFALKSKSFVIASIIIILYILVGVFGPLFLQYEPMDYVGPGMNPPSGEFWFGTTMFGQDVFTQCIYGIRAALVVGLLGGVFATLVGLFVGFFAGYKGGWIDEGLMMLTNILMVIPTMALLIIIASFLESKSVVIEGVIIGLTAWPWTARAVRSQTFSLKQRGFVDLSRISGRKTMKIIIEDIAPNMMSYVFLVFIIQFGGAILAATGLDFIGLGPSDGVTLGLMMSFATGNNAIQLGMWWWALPPGIIITILVGCLYMMNVGLDEVFNPKLRST